MTTLQLAQPDVKRNPMHRLWSIKVGVLYHDAGMSLPDAERTAGAEPPKWLVADRFLAKDQHEADALWKLYSANQTTQDVLTSAREVVAAAAQEPTGAQLPFLLAVIDSLLSDAMWSLYEAEPVDDEGAAVYRYDGDDEVVTDYSPTGEVTAVRVNGVVATW